MLSDEEQAALNAFLDTQIDLFVRTNRLMPPLEFNQALFAAGIAYAQKWRSMESAPKDGTAIMLGNAGGSWIARYEPVYPSGYRPENPWFSLMLNRDYMQVKNVPPTHWMPLPLPLTQGAK